MIVFACPSCQKPLRIGAEHAGKQIRCPGCEHRCRIPPLSAAPVQPGSPSTAKTSAAPAGVVSERPTLPPTTPTNAQEDLPPAVSVETATLPPAPATSKASAAALVDSVPGYEIVGELGRGGMGVVYKARQIGLNRPCALKMILAGGHAGEADLARFRTEGEAIARLQHPNIVAVYEVGTHEGKPFFSLEFCSGGSLDRKLAGTPVDPTEAAKLVRTLAQAMHAAHQANVIHRDLKPANVLLSPPHPPAPSPTRGEGEPELLAPPSPTRGEGGWGGEGWQPKITDFGLARQLDQQGQTQTGAIMGTPSYMAPEQAEGKKDIGPPADVYALGAILYECLTGRPPFKAATALDTILQVVSDEPVPPRQLNAKVPADLETICLKCLQKEPSKRYGSAAELADDLGRFLAGEPIQARPVGRIEQAGKWVRRNPVVAALMAAVAASLLLGACVATLFAVQSNLNATTARAETERANAAAENARKLAGERAVALTQVEAEKKNVEKEAERANKEAENARKLAGERAVALKLVEAEKRNVDKELAKAEFVAYAFRLREAQAAIERGRLPDAEATLRECEPRFRGWEYDYLRRQTQRNIWVGSQHTLWVTSVAFQPRRQVHRLGMPGQNGESVGRSHGQGRALSSQATRARS